MLQCVLSTLHTMGYQCCVAVLQAGEYGAAQQRRRVIVLGAGPGRSLPRLPDPTHVFPAHGSLAIHLGKDKTRISNSPRRKELAGSAPHRAITVRDVLSDLPNQTGGLAYTGPPRSAFQRRVRAGGGELTDHCSLELSAADQARVSLIPRQPGADWRDLPNIEIQLSDGSKLGKLSYTGGSVCPCVDGKACESQPNTTIPWFLSHTADKNGHWKDAYGRLDYSGIFRTTLTKPKLDYKQGRVIHPTADRVISVREAARSQVATVIQLNIFSINVYRVSLTATSSSELWNRNTDKLAMLCPV